MGLIHNMKKMYTNKPVVETDPTPFTPIKYKSEFQRIDALEEKVRQLSEQVHKIATVLELNSRQLRRQNTNIDSIGRNISNQLNKR